MALEKELEVYHGNLAKLKDHAGKYVLIHGDEIVDYFAAYEDAIKAGYQKFCLEPFLVKQISGVQSVQHITRNVLPFSSTSAAIVS